MQLTPSSRYTLTVQYAIAFSNTFLFNWCHGLPFNKGFKFVVLSELTFIPNSVLQLNIY